MLCKQISDLPVKRNCQNREVFLGYLGGIKLHQFGFDSKISGSDIIFQLLCKKFVNEAHVQR